MKQATINTRWASLKLTAAGSAVIGVKANGSLSCFYFENTDDLAEAIKTRRIRVKHWIIGVRDDLCIRKSVDLPARDVGQAYRMLEFELPSYVPLPTEGLAYGCVSAGQGGDLLGVSAYILKTTHLESILHQCQQIGIRPAKVLVDSVAAEAWFNSGTTPGSTAINLLFGQEYLFISAVAKGDVVRHGEMLLQNDDLPRQNEDIIDEINLIADEMALDTQQIALRIAADGGRQGEVKRWLEERFGAIECLTLPEIKAFDTGVDFPADRCAWESIVTLGLCNTVGNSDLSFLNLLPRRTLRRAERKQLVGNAIAALILLACLIFCMWLNFALMNWRIEWTSQTIAREITPIEHIAADVESKRQKVKAIQKQLANRDQISNIFSHLYKYSPKEVSISQMDYSSRTGVASINIRGQADTLSRAFEYSDAMKESELLSNMQIVNAQQIPRPGGSVVEFKAQCAVRGG